jgi:hypothetical protein
MGKMKQIAIAKLDAADALWAKAMHHHDQWVELKKQQEACLNTQANEHVLDYHSYKAFSFECDWIDATGHYEHVTGDLDSLRGFDDSFLDLPKEHECEM